jgi:DNA repair ATPase RecN
VDLHLHTPGAHSFSCPPGLDLTSEDTRDDLAKQYAARLQSAGIGICALTDYNGIIADWYDRIRYQAGLLGIQVLPGAELDVAWGGRPVHILVVFGEDMMPEDLNQIVRGYHQDSRAVLLQERAQHTQLRLKDGLGMVGVLKELRDKHGALVMLAHPGSDSGVLKSRGPKGTTEFIYQTQPDALDHMTDGDLRRLVSAGLSRQTIDSLARVEFSDPKSMDEIGQKTTGALPRATFLKLSGRPREVGIDAIRLALHEPQLRVTVGSPPPLTHPRLLSIEIDGQGFLGRSIFKLNPDLNVLVGGRGTGKSALLEALRYGMGLAPAADQSYKEALVKHALGSGGKVTIELERPVGHGESRRYHVSRVYGSQPAVVESGTSQLLQLTPSQLLGPGAEPLILGQREMYYLSQDDEFRARLLDDLIGDDVKRKASEVKAVALRLGENAEAIASARRRMIRKEELAQRLKAVENELKVYSRLDAARKLDEVATLAADRESLTRARQSMDSARNEWHVAAEELAESLRRIQRSLQRGASRHKPLLDRASQRLEQARSDVAARVEDIRGVLGGLAADLDKLSAEWASLMLPLEEEINRIKQEAHTNHLDPDRLVQLNTEKASLEPQMDELTRVEHHLAALEQAREAMLGQLRTSRHDEHTLRRDRTAEIQNSLGGQIRLTVGYGGQKAVFRNQLTALLSGSRIPSDDISGLTQTAEDGRDIADSVKIGVSRVQTRFGLTAARATTLVRWFGDDPPKMHQLETIVPPDSLEVELKIDGSYRSLGVLSAGQRATAILLLLFALPKRPLILDQPEDDLDGRFVYEGVVQTLRDLKSVASGGASRRQIIAATHNPNIPVIGDADLVVALEAAEGKMRLGVTGAMDTAKVREAIRDTMEGGDAAFRRRHEKYRGWRALT